MLVIDFVQRVTPPGEINIASNDVILLLLASLASTVLEKKVFVVKLPVARRSHYPANVVGRDFQQ